MSRRAALQTAVLAIVLLAAPAHVLAGDVEQAKTLFDQAVSDLLAGRLDKACPAIDRSYRLDPRPGTLFTLAECEAQRGRIATAAARYTEYLALYKQFTPKKRAEQKDRADTSRSQIATLTPQIPQVTLRLPEDAPDDVQVRHDGEILPTLSLASPVAVDPGENLFTTQVPGGPPVEHRLVVKKGESRELALVVLREVPAAPAGTADASAAPSGMPAPAASGAPASSATSTAALPPAAAPSSVAHDNRAFRIGAIAVGTVGVSGIVFGAVTGILALDRKATVGRECQPDATGEECSPAGVSAGEQLKVLAAGSTAAFVIGAAGLASAGVLLMLAPSSRPATPARPPSASLGVSATAGGLRVFGSF